MTAHVLARTHAEEPVLEYGPADPGFAAFELGRRLLVDAVRLSESRACTDSALLLFRAALLALGSARFARASGHDTVQPAAEGSWPRLQQLTDAAELIEQLPADRRALLQKLLAPDFDEVRLLGLAASERERGLAASRRLAFVLAEPLERDASAARRRQTARRARFAALTCLVLLVLGGGLVRVLQRPNLALHKPVFVDSPDPHFDVDHARVVDGDRTNLGFHTLTRGLKRVTIDLETVHRIRRVDIYNRLDCCQERAAPLSVEVSRDGNEFQRVARRNRRFALWKASFPPVEARWVRIVQTGDDAFHLSEIEVY
jgi:hypothetical protein